MPLSIHLSIHVILSLLAGFFVYQKFKFKEKKYLCFLLAMAFTSGFLVDLDHFIDYFLAFGFSFNLTYFLRGYEFLKSDKIYTLFHGFEYVALLFIAYLYVKDVKKKAIFLAVLLGLLSHLLFDIYANELPPSAYLITNRLYHRFELKKLVYPEHYQKHIEQKKQVVF